MKATVYVNRHIVASNKKNNEDKPSISINTYLGVVYCKTLEFGGGATLIQDKAKARCSGATIWLEVEDFLTLVIDGQVASNSMFKVKTSITT
jgi:hypothetical protein